MSSSSPESELHSSFNDSIKNTNNNFYKNPFDKSYDSYKHSFDNEMKPKQSTLTIEIKNENKRYWTEEEHDKFLICLCFLHSVSCKGLPVNKISQYIKTRTPIQVRTHAQKYFMDKKKIIHSQQRIVNLMKNDIENIKLIFGEKKQIMLYKSIVN